MLKERGKMKWQSAAFLLEHADSLKQFFKEYDYKTKPELTSDKLVEINQTILEGLEYNLTLNFSYYNNHDFHLLIGNTVFVDELKQELRIMDLHNSLHKLKFTDIVDVKIN
jgi:hypothetical protein